MRNPSQTINIRNKNYMKNIFDNITDIKKQI